MKKDELIAMQVLFGRRVIFLLLVLSVDFSSKLTFKPFFQEHHQSVKRVGIQARTDFLSALIWIQTVYKGYQHVKLLNQFLTEKHQESREIHTIPAAELDRYVYLPEFVINVRKADGTEYEPSYLRGMISSFDRQLKRH